MSDELFLCIGSCHNPNNSGAVVGNDSYDLDCVTRCTQLHTNSYYHTAKKYTYIVQIIAIVLITFGFIGKIFNGIIFLRKPLRGTSTGLLLLLKTIFDFVPLLWTFIFDTKFFVNDEQINASRLICVLSRSSDIFVSWSIGFVILACTVRLATIIHLKFLPQPTRLHVFILILIMMVCGLLYNWHVFYYPSFVETILADDKNQTLIYCNIIFGRQMGYFSFGGFVSTQELLYNAPIVNFIVSSLIPFTIVASTNIIIILHVIRRPISKKQTYNNGKYLLSANNQSHNNFEAENLTLKHDRTHITYETTITLTTSCVFLTTNSIASIYVYVKSSHRANRSHVTEDLKTSSVYLILRMLSLIDTVLEFYIYFLTGRKFRQDVYHVIREILQHTPLRNYVKFTVVTTNSIDNTNEETRKLSLIQHGSDRKKNMNSDYLKLTQSSSTTLSRNKNYMDSRQKQNVINYYHCDESEALERIESTV